MKRRFGFGLAILLLPVWAAELGPLEGHSFEGEGLVLNCGAASVSLEAVTPEVIRYQLELPGVDGSSWAVVEQQNRPAALEVSETPSGLTITTKALNIEVARENCGITFADDQGVLQKDLLPVSFQKAEAGYATTFTFALPLDQHIYGLGEKGGRMDHRHKTVSMWNSDTFGYGTGHDPLYVSIPFYLGLRDGQAHGVFFDNSSETFFDFGNFREDRLVMRSSAGGATYYFIAGPEPKQVVERYTGLTGRMPLPPLWSLGHQISRWAYFPQWMPVEIAQQAREHQIPLDAVYLDLTYHKDYLPFTWDPVHFPDPAGMVRELNSLGVKTVVIVDPALKVDPGYSVYQAALRRGFLLKNPDGSPYTALMWPGVSAWPDFYNPEVREWWGGLYAELVQTGVAGIWNDMNEPAVFDQPYGAVPAPDDPAPTGTHYRRSMPLTIKSQTGGTQHTQHNLFALAEVMGTYQGLDRLMGNNRPFLLSRAGYAGIQRYAAIWTGDNTSSFEHLEVKVPMLLNMSVSGLPMVGADIGGFVGNATPELLVRWYQASVFDPLFRNHTAKGTYDQEPWVYGEGYLAPIRDVINLRYRLMPYLYTAVEQASRTGQPVLRPLYFQFPDDPETYAIEDQFMAGDSLLLAPVLKEGATSRRLYLPAGIWYDYWSKEQLKGGRWINYPVKLETLPLFVRAGSVIPWQSATMSTAEKPSQYGLEVYPGPDTAVSYWYSDNGRSQAGDSRLVSLELKPGQRSLTLASSQEGEYSGPNQLKVSFYGLPPGATISGSTSEGKAKVINTTLGNDLEVKW